MATLSWAIERKHWELAALCLLFGLMEALNRLPPDAIDDLIEVLDGSEGGKRNG